MSIAPLAVEALPAPADPAVRRVVKAVEAAVVEAVAAAGAGQWASVADAEVLDLVARLGRVSSQVAALRLGGLAEAERRQAARRLGVRSTGAWLRTTGVRPGAAHHTCTHRPTDEPATGCAGPLMG